MFSASKEMLHCFKDDVDAVSGSMGPRCYCASFNNHSGHESPLHVVAQISLHFSSMSPSILAQKSLIKMSQCYSSWQPYNNTEYLICRRGCIFLNYTTCIRLSLITHQLVTERMLRQRF